jgi:hypothetical protein
MLTTGVSGTLGAAVYLDSSPLKPFGQMNRNLVGSIYGNINSRKDHGFKKHNFKLNNS